MTDPPGEADISALLRKDILALRLQFMFAEAALWKLVPTFTGIPNHPEDVTMML
jgi:hypothetical protein